MEQNALDLDSLAGLLVNILKQMDEDSLKDIASMADLEPLQAIILETIGIAKERLSDEERKNITPLLHTVLEMVRSGDPVSEN